MQKDEVNWSSFGDNMTVQIHIPKETIDKLLQLNEFKQVCWIQNQCKKSTAKKKSHLQFYSSANIIRKIILKKMKKIKQFQSYPIPRNKFEQDICNKFMKKIVRLEGKTYFENINCQLDHVLETSIAEIHKLSLS